MRITGGLAKGIPLKVASKSIVRPATDALRQSIFSSLGSLVEDAVFLDLFAGTGAYGLEAWSRGAQFGYFVEKDRKSIESIKQNIAAVAKSIQKDSSLCRIIQADVFKNPIPQNLQFDLVFADPPYSLFDSNLSQILEVLPLWLKKNESSRLILEAPANLSFDGLPNLTLLRKLGKNSPNSPAAFIFSPTAS